jgi:hypothetical protein
MARYKDLTGFQFGSLTVLEYAGNEDKNGIKRALWKVRCSCGVEKTCRAGVLLAGAKTCGLATHSTGIVEVFDDHVIMHLTKGQVAIVDRDAYDSMPVLRRQWYASYSGAAWYATKNKRLMHRLIMNAEPGQEVDHISHDTLDNRRANLRICNHQENCSNLLARKNKKTSTYKGVYYEQDRDKWVTRVYCKGHKRFFQRFDTEIEAALAYNEQAARLFGEYAYLNPMPA